MLRWINCDRRPRPRSLVAHGRHRDHRAERHPSKVPTAKYPGVAEHAEAVHRSHRDDDAVPGGSRRYDGIALAPFVAGRRFAPFVRMVNHGSSERRRRQPQPSGDDDAPGPSTPPPTLLSNPSDCAPIRNFTAPRVTNDNLAFTMRTDRPILSRNHPGFQARLYLYRLVILRGEASASSEFSKE